MPEDRQGQYSPAVDKQTIHILAETDEMAARIEELKHVGSIVKSFLRMPDDDGKEKGMHKWIQPDGRIHANFALTETGRPRTWQPNILNWPKNIAKPIENAFARLNEESGDNQAPISLRSNIQAPDGWAIVEMDLKTAEVVALAYISGDDNMIRVLTEPDEQFVLSKDDPEGENPIRIAFNNNADYPDDQKTDDLIETSPDDPDIQRHEDGSPIHPKRDLHWEICEELFAKPRERLSKKRDRGGAGKVANFCCYAEEPVLTDRGEVPIKDVQATDLVWDGEEWVFHEGVVYQGKATVHYWDGLWATDNHEVWVEDSQLIMGQSLPRKRKVLFGKARREGLPLYRVSGIPRPNHQESPRMDGVDVYDILNAGPRHRFTCSGVLVSNSIPYGASPPLLERMIEVQTGNKPEEGTGQSLIDRYEARYPVAAAFLRYMEAQVENPGWYRSISGRLRHFKFNELVSLDGLSDRLKESIRSPLIRQARNFPIQEIVAATTAHAMLNFIDQRRRQGLESRIPILLYDAIALLAPLEELKTVIPMLRSCLTDQCQWDIDGRVLQFGTDLSVMFRWGVKPTPEEKSILEQYLP